MPYFSNVSLNLHKNGWLTHDSFYLCYLLSCHRTQEIKNKSQKQPPDVCSSKTEMTTDLSVIKNVQLSLVVTMRGFENTKIQLELLTDQD